MAADRNGHLGAFMTAGTGPIPMAALSSVSTPLSKVECEISRLPTVTQARLLVSVKRPDDWINFAERGFFVFDWTEAVDAYIAVAQPTVPLQIGMLPDDLAALAESTRAMELVFGGGTRVTISTYFRCIEPE